MNDFKEKMKTRTREAAINALKICDALPETTSFSVVKRQLVRCATAVGANYRAACRAKSRADFVNKMQTVEEECDESVYWVEIIEILLDVKSDAVINLKKEFDEILSIVVTALKTAKGVGEG